MNYRLAFVLSYECFENALICIISIGPSTKLKPIFNFPTFRKNRTSLELLNIVFEHSLPNRFFWCNKNKWEFFDLTRDSLYLQTTALKSWLFQNTIFKLIYCQCSHFLNLNLQSRRTLQCDRFWTFKLTESWGKSENDSKGEVDTSK